MLLPEPVKIDRDDRDSILWMQLALSVLLKGAGDAVHIGRISSLTVKALRLYQLSRNLPTTGEADEVTLAKIKQELKERGLTP